MYRNIEKNKGYVIWDEIERKLINEMVKDEKKNTDLIILQIEKRDDRICSMEEKKKCKTW